MDVRYAIGPVLTNQTAAKVGEICLIHLQLRAPQPWTIGSLRTERPRPRSQQLHWEETSRHKRTPIAASCYCTNEGPVGLLGR